MTTKKTKISLSTNNTTMSIEFDNFDVDLGQFFQAFKTLMIGATFSEDQYNNWIIDEGELLSENNDYNIPKSNLF
jgi:hypothetical protein